MRFLKILSVLVVVLSVTSCAMTPQARIAKNRAAFDAFPAEVQEKVRAGRVDLGFTPLMVTLALGEPDRELNRSTEAGKEEVWVYRRTASGLSFGLGVGGGSGRTGYGGGISMSTAPDYDEDAMRVIFRDGKVTAVEKRVK